MRTHSALLIAAALLLACDDDSPTAPEGAAIFFETIVQESYSGFADPQRTVVHDEGELARLWQAFHAGQSPVPVLPTVDFGRESVVLAAAGSRSDGCYSIEITQALYTAGGIILFEVTETVPGPACICTQAITRPAHLVRVAHPAAAAAFVERVVQRSC